MIDTTSSTKIIFEKNKFLNKNTAIKKYKEN